MKKICIINTGGTIGMVPSEKGYVPRKGELEKELREIRDIRSGKIAEWDLLEFDPVLDSSNVKYEQWNLIADTIAERYGSYDGFVVLHGTDTMAYSASALSFMLEGLDKPVVFTGSQIPLCEIRSDGRDNIITSITIAAEGRVREVTLYFGNRLLRGNRSVKQSSDELIAFASPNYPELASAGIDITYNDAFIRHPQNGSHLKVSRIRDTRIGIIKMFPGMQSDLLKPLVQMDTDGLLLETFGTGNIPGYDIALITLIKEAVANDIAVVVLTQCPQGNVKLGTYETGALLAHAGVTDGHNMTTEAAVTKLQYLLSKGIHGSDLRSLMETDLRGELTAGRQEDLDTSGDAGDSLSDYGMTVNVQSTSPVTQERFSALASREA